MAVKHVDLAKHWQAHLFHELMEERTTNVKVALIGTNWALLYMIMGVVDEDK